MEYIGGLYAKIGNKYVKVTDTQYVTDLENKKTQLIHSFMDAM